MPTKKDKQNQEEIDEAIKILGDKNRVLEGNTFEDIQNIAKQIPKEHLKKMKESIKNDTY